MKFLLELVSCCGPIARQSVPTTSPPRMEKTRSLMLLSCSGSDPSPRRKRGKVTGSNSVSTAQWRPSLCAISEDKVVYVVTGKAERTVRSGKKLAGKAGSRARTRVRDHSDNEFRRTPVAVVIPAFSPTGFLF